MPNNLPLTMAQIKADIILVDAAIKEAEKISAKELRKKCPPERMGFNLQSVF